MGLKSILLHDLDEEWGGLGSREDAEGRADPIEEEYEDEEQLATVTVVEDFDPEELLRPGRPHEDANDDEDAEMEDAPSVAPKRDEPKVVESKKTKTKAAAKAKDVKYQTNAARKVERAKQIRRKKEKAERAGGKGMRKGKRTQGRR